MSDKVRENRLRRQAKRLGLWLRKSRARLWSLDNQGDYMLVDLQYNVPVADSARFDLSLDDVEQWLSEYEASLREAAE